MQITEVNANLLKLERKYTGFYNHTVGRAEVQVATGSVGLWV